MKFFKSLSIFLVFALAVGGLALGSLSFNNTLADEANLQEVTVNESNAAEVFSAPWQYSSITLSSDLDFAELGITLNASTSKPCWSRRCTCNSLQAGFPPCPIRLYRKIGMRRILLAGAHPQELSPNYSYELHRS